MHDSRCVSVCCHSMSSAVKMGARRSSNSSEDSYHTPLAMFWNTVTRDARVRGSGTLTISLDPSFRASVTRARGHKCRSGVLTRPTTEIVMAAGDC
jgi:hypothetical protein